MTELLGEIVTWDLPGGEVEYTAVVDALTRAGLDPALCEETGNKTAFRRALGELRDGRSIDKLQISGVDAVQLTKKESAGDHIDFSYETTIKFDPVTGSFDCADTEIAGETTAAYIHHRGRRTASDITRMVQRMFKNHAELYPINPRKGVAYFVPAKHADFTKKVEAFLKDVGGSLPRFPIPTGTTEGNANVASAISGGLSELIDELNAKVLEFNESTRGKTKESALQRIQEIQYKITAYDEFLADTKSALAKKLDDAKARLFATMAEETPAEAQSEVPPAQAAVA